MDYISLEGDKNTRIRVAAELAINGRLDNLQKEFAVSDIRTMLNVYVQYLNPDLRGKLGPAPRGMAETIDNRVEGKMREY